MRESRLTARVDKEYQKRVAKFWPLDTLLKISLLAVTGRLSKINARVFGTAAVTEKPKKR